MLKIILFEFCLMLTPSLPYCRFPWRVKFEEENQKQLTRHRRAVCDVPFLLGDRISKSRPKVDQNEHRGFRLFGHCAPTVGYKSHRRWNTSPISTHKQKAIGCSLVTTDAGSKKICRPHHQHGHLFGLDARWGSCNQNQCSSTSLRGVDAAN